MNILVVPSWYPRSKEDNKGVYFREQALALKAHGHDVRVMFNDLYGWRELGSLFHRRSDIAGSKDLPLVWTRHPAIFSRQPVLLDRWASRIGLRGFEAILRSGWAPDAMVAHSIFSAGSAACEIYLKHNIPYVLVEHSSKFSRFVLGDAHRRIAERVERNAAVRLAVSDDLRGKVASFIGSDAAWGLLPNSVDPAFEYATAKDFSALDSVRYVFVGNLVSGKQVDILLRAFAKAFGSSKNVDLRIVGDGVELDSLKRLTKDLQISRVVHFVGRLSREGVLEELTNATFLVQPSKYETFGVAIAEALAVGVPVIAFRSGGPSEIVRDGDGILVAEQTLEALACALKESLERRSSFNRDSIKKRCLARFSSRSLASELAAHCSRAISAVERQAH